MGEIGGFGSGGGGRADRNLETAIKCRRSDRMSGAADDQIGEWAIERRDELVRCLLARIGEWSAAVVEQAEKGPVAARR